MSKRNSFTYYKIKSKHIPYHGQRFFQVNSESFDATTVVLSCGDVKKGKGNQVGVYTISKLTLFGNYLAMERCEPITRRQYLKAFKDAVRVVLDP